MNKKRAVVVGGGWAGCSAAWRLATAGWQVTLVEKRKGLGGRAGSGFYPRWGVELDVGQHLFLGAYEQTLKLLNEMGTADKIGFGPRLQVCFLSSKGPQAFKAAALPGPLGLLGAFVSFGLLSGKEKREALSFGLKAWRGLRDPSVLGDRDTRAWLLACGQSPAMIRKFWEPFCLAVFNAPSDQAPAPLFAKVLKDGFLKGGKASALGISRVPLSQLLAPLNDRVEVRSGIGVKGIRGKEVALENGEVLKADAVVLALSPWLAARQIERSVAARLGIADLSAIKASPIVTVYAKGSRPYLPAPICAFSAEDLGPFHWAIEQPGLGQSFVASSAGDLAAMPAKKILAILERQMAAQVSGFDPALIQEATVLKEARATPVFRPGQARLPQKTAVSGLALAGDWTDTGLPATIESAVLSGKLAAEALA